MSANYKDIQVKIRNISGTSKPIEFYADQRVIQAINWRSALKKKLIDIPKEKRPNKWTRIEIIIDVL